MTGRIPNINVPRLPATNVIRDMPAPPVTQQLQPPIINIPGYVPPRYDAPQVEPSYSPEPGGVGGGSQQTQTPDETLPGLGLPETPPAAPPPTRGTEIEVGGVVIPVPTTKEVTLAGTTAIASVTAALLGKSLVDQLLKVFKPIAKRLILKIKQKLGKKLTEQEIQLFFALEQEQKALTKRLLKDQKKQVVEQKLRQRQHK